MTDDSPISARSSKLPRFAELPDRDGLHCSWGIWGDHDVLGTLNNLSPERIAAAARQISRGVTFSLDLPWSEPGPPIYGRPVFQHHILRGRGFGGISTFENDELDAWNTQVSSQWDGFRHVEREGHGWYSGIPDTEHGVHFWTDRGIVGRSVLLDLGRWRDSIGRPIRHDIPDPIEPEEVLACIAQQGVEFEVGDVLLIRTGWAGWYKTLDLAERTRLSEQGGNLASSGLRASDAMAEVLWDLHISAVAADNPALETSPVGGAESAEDDDAPDPVAARAARKGLHVRILPMLGIPLGELFWFEDLADDCAADGRYTSFFTSAPVKLPFGVASPPNAYAIK